LKTLISRRATKKSAPYALVDMSSALTYQRTTPHKNKIARIINHNENIDLRWKSVPLRNCKYFIYRQFDWVHEGKRLTRCR